MKASLLFLLGLLAACSTSNGAPPIDASTTDIPEVRPAAEGAPDFLTRVDGAVALNAASDSGSLAVAWTTHENVMAAEVEVETGDLTGVAVVSGEVAPMAHPIERPAIAIHPDGSVDVAFTSHSASGGSVYLARQGQDPTVISGSPRPETNLVHATMDVSGDLMLAWLEDSTLSVGLSVGDSVTELEEIDDLTCDCCHPAPLVSGASMVVAYRDFDRVEGRIARNVVAITSTDAGESFGPPVDVADDDWFISGCPFTGPAAGSVGDLLIVAWMDARQSRHPEQSNSSIWVDRSFDMGGTFGTDVEVVGHGRHRWPTIAVDDRDVVHLVWETAGEDGGLFYAWSVDEGETFSEPAVLVDRELSDGGAPSAPSAVYHEGFLVVTWAADGGGYVAGWDLAP